MAAYVNYDLFDSQGVFGMCHQTDVTQTTSSCGKLGSNIQPWWCSVDKTFKY